MDDREIKSWDARLLQQHARGWDNYMRRRINLDAARALEPMNVAGEFLYVEKVSSKSARAIIAINRNTNDAIELEFGTVVKTVFTQLFFTHDAQAGEWIDLIIGINFEYYRQQAVLSAEAQPAITLTKVAPGNAQAVANPCNRVLIRAHTNNAGTVWVNFGAAGAVNTCYELTPGDAISAACSNTDRIQGWFVNGGDLLTIIFEA